MNILNHIACSPSSNSAERTCQLLKTKCVNERQKENLVSTTRKTVYGDGHNN